MKKILSLFAALCLAFSAAYADEVEVNLSSLISLMGDQRFESTTTGEAVYVQSGSISVLPSNGSVLKDGDTYQIESGILIYQFYASNGSINKIVETHRGDVFYPVANEDQVANLLAGKLFSDDEEEISICVRDNHIVNTNGYQYIPNGYKLFKYDENVYAIMSPTTRYAIVLDKDNTPLSFDGTVLTPVDLFAKLATDLNDRTFFGLDDQPFIHPEDDQVYIGDQTLQDAGYSIAYSIGNPKIYTITKGDDTYTFSLYANLRTSFFHNGQELFPDNLTNAYFVYEKAVYVSKDKMHSICDYVLDGTTNLLSGYEDIFCGSSYYSHKAVVRLDENNFIQFSEPYSWGFYNQMIVNKDTFYLQDYLPQLLNALGDRTYIKKYASESPAIYAKDGNIYKKNTDGSETNLSADGTYVFADGSDFFLVSESYLTTFFVVNDKVIECHDNIFYTLPAVDDATKENFFDLMGTNHFYADNGDVIYYSDGKVWLSKSSPDSFDSGYGYGYGYGYGEGNNLTALDDNYSLYKIDEDYVYFFLTNDYYFFDVQDGKIVSIRKGDDIFNAPPTEEDLIKLFASDYYVYDRDNYVCVKDGHVIFTNNGVEYNLFQDGFSFSREADDCIKYSASSEDYISFYISDGKIYQAETVSATLYPSIPVKQIVAPGDKATCVNNDNETVLTIKDQSISINLPEGETYSIGQSDFFEIVDGNYIFEIDLDEESISLIIYVDPEGHIMEISLGDDFLTLSEEKTTIYKKPTVFTRVSALTYNESGLLVIETPDGSQYGTNGQKIK